MVSVSRRGKIGDGEIDVARLAWQEGVARMLDRESERCRQRETFDRRRKKKRIK